MYAIINAWTNRVLHLSHKWPEAQRAYEDLREIADPEDGNPYRFLTLTRSEIRDNSAMATLASAKVPEEGKGLLFCSVGRERAGAATGSFDQLEVCDVEALD